MNWPPILESHWLGNSLKSWLLAVAAFFLSWIILSLLQRILLKRLERLATKTSTQLDDLVVGLVKKTQFFFILSISLYISLQLIQLPGQLQRLIHGLLIAVILLMAAIWGSAIITFVVSSLVQKRLSDDAASATTVSVIGFVGKFILWSAIVLLALDNFGIDVTTLIAGLGIGGIAVALAAQNVLGDLFASLAIVLDKPFVIGDFVIIDEHRGVIEKIGLKTTRIRSLSGEQLVFANTDLLSSRIQNYKRMQERRILFAFGVVYQTPYEKLKKIPQIVREIIDAEEKARFNRTHFFNYGASSLDYEVVYYMLDPEYNAYMDTQQSINLEIFRRFEAEGIEFAYPTRTLYVNKE